VTMPTKAANRRRIAIALGERRERGAHVTKASVCAAATHAAYRPRPYVR
jgi:hypothetical protein